MVDGRDQTVARADQHEDAPDHLAGRGAGIEAVVATDPSSSHRRLPFMHRQTVPICRQAAIAAPEHTPGPTLLESRTAAAGPRSAATFLAGSATA